jgi:serine/threonine protein kinase
MRPDEVSQLDHIGRYHVVRLIGQGAMGRVYLAHDAILDRHVAIKLLRDDLGLPPEHLEILFERMRQEARASARVSHPNIVALYDMGEDVTLGLYLVFEYIEGLTLKQRIQQGKLGPELVRRLALELGGALSLAHEAGVLHRDIKPENVMLARTGSKIADFGIARVPDSTLTRDGRLLGTPAYSAPEAISHGTFSSASDQFSLATTLYEALCLHRAFPGDDAVAVAARITYEEPPPLAAICGLDTHVDTVFARALSKNPRARFDSCEQFGQALAEALDLPGRRSVPTVPEARLPSIHPAPSQPGHNGVRMVAAAALGGLVTLVAWQLILNFRAEPAPLALDAGDPSPSSAKTNSNAFAKPAGHRRASARLLSPGEGSNPADSSTGVASRDGPADAGWDVPNTR